MDFEQLRLLPPPRPFSSRLGKQFFKELPKLPGVYLMRDRSEKIIYVGQSSNLKQRLSSYKYLHPDKTSRKIMRLMFRVDKVELRVCGSADEALLLENELLARHNPTYNTANVYPPAYRYLHLHQTESEWQIALTPHISEMGATYGAFKGSGYAAYASLIRLVWTVIHKPASHIDFPCCLLGEKPFKQFAIARKSECQDMWGQLHSFLGGESDRLVETLTEAVHQQAHSHFMTHFLHQDLAAVQAFYSAAQRNQKLRKQFGIEASFIPQDRLNELILRGRKKKVTEAANCTSEEASTHSAHPQSLPIPLSPVDHPRGPAGRGSEQPSSQLLFQ